MHKEHPLKHLFKKYYDSKKMSNKIATICKDDVTRFIKDESENISIIRSHIGLIKEARLARSIVSLFDFDGADEPQPKEISEIKRDIFERCKFDFGESIDEAHISLIEETEDLTHIESEIIEIFSTMNPTQKRDFSIMVALREGGQAIIQGNKIIDLHKVGIPVTFHCPICQNDSEIKLSILAISEGYTVKSACKHCNHIEAPRKPCKCDFCKKNSTIFDLAKLIEAGLTKTKSKANKRLQTAIDKEELVHNEVDLLNLFAKFMSLRNSLSEDAKRVVESVISCYSITGEFDHNTYQFTQNIVGQDNASAVASELYKAGFFFKVGFVPRANDLGISPSFGIKSKYTECMTFDKNGILTFSDDIKPTTDDEDSVLIINKGFLDDFYVHFEVQPIMRSIFKANHFILEHEVHGGILSAKDAEDKVEEGSILKNKITREAYLREKESGEYPHIFPDIRIGRLIDLEDLRRIMIASTLTILEGFEASIVCYDDNFNPQKIYLHKTSQSIDVVKNSVVPMLQAKGIEVVMI